MREPTTHLDSNNEALDDLFHEVLELPNETRRDWLLNRCDNNQELLDEILSLVEAHENSDDFLNDSAVSELKSAAKIDYSGKRVGAWQLQSVIGRGGMGTVYKAYRCDGQYEQTVAVKVGPSTGLRRELFSKERQVLANLSHPVITRILDAGDIPDSGDAYLVMDYVDGMTLLDYIDDNSHLSKTQKIRLISTVLDALHQAHCQGVIHCDIKSENILVSSTGEVKLLDFGISNTVNEVDAQEGHALKAMTPTYASPQRLEGAQPTIGDDVYAAGLLFGLVQCDKNVRATIVSKGVNTQVQSIADQLEPELQSIFHKATNVDSAQRYSSAQAFYDDIDRWNQHLPIPVHAGGPTYKLRKLFQRHQFASIAAALLVGVFVLSGFAWHSYNQKLQFEQSQQAQVREALELSQAISEGLDLRVSQLPGSLPVRIATAETALIQLQKIHEQQPNNADVKVAVAKSNMLLQGFYFSPARMHIGDIQTGFEKLRTGYELAYDAYRLDRNFKNLAQLARATNRVTEILMIVNNEQETYIPYELEIADEYNKYEPDNALATAIKRSQLHILFRYHIIKNELDEAKKLIDQSTAENNVSRDGLTKFELNRVATNKSRTLELKAVYEMIAGDRVWARDQFLAIAKQHENNKIWNNKRRALYAYRSVACIDLLAQSPDYASVSEQLHNARLVAVSLSDQFPNATSFRWELLELEGIMESATLRDLSTGVVTPANHEVFVESAACDQLSFLHMPAPPPGGWEEVISQFPYDVGSIFKSLN